ncbi:MAG TPA: DUF1190 domain-containing protein [Candidatus Omnitrophota bacterium]|nr:DUF1190 domain-containing protein [Candidatus Omnitrophota bacterium]
MRRSKRIATLTAGGACLVILAACDDSAVLPDTVTIHPNIDSCTQATGKLVACQQAFSEALSAHYTQAQKHPDRASCEERYGQGNCTPIQGQRGEAFVPAIAGFVLGSALGVASGVPVHYDRQGYARVVGGFTLGKKQEEEEQQSSSGGGSGGGGSWSKGSRKPTTISTADSNLRGSRIMRGGFGNSFSFHGGG